MKARGHHESNRTVANSSRPFYCQFLRGDGHF